MTASRQAKQRQSSPSVGLRWVGGRHKPSDQSCCPQGANVAEFQSERAKNLHGGKPTKLARRAFVLLTSLCQGSFSAIQVCLWSDPFHSLNPVPMRSSS